MRVARLHGLRDVRLHEEAKPVPGPGERLVRAVREGDLATLTQVPRVGKKLAERLVLELRDKLDGAELPTSGAKAVIPVVPVHEYQRALRHAAPLDGELPGKKEPRHAAEPDTGGIRVAPLEATKKQAMPGLPSCQALGMSPGFGVLDPSGGAIRSAGGQSQSGSWNLLTRVITGP